MARRFIDNIYWETLGNDKIGRNLIVAIIQNKWKKLLLSLKKELTGGELVWKAFRSF